MEDESMIEEDATNTSYTTAFDEWQNGAKDVQFERTVKGLHMYSENEKELIKMSRNIDTVVDKYGKAGYLVIAGVLTNPDTFWELFKFQSNVNPFSIETVRMMARLVNAIANMRSECDKVDFIKEFTKQIEEEALNIG